MKLRTLTLASVLTTACVALLSSGPAQAFRVPNGTSSTSSKSSGVSTNCTEPAVSQPFLSFGDSSWYSLAPGESYDQFTAAGWTLSNGAYIGSSTLQDGTTGSVLVLPNGSQAVSPPLCVDNSYPYLKAMLQAVHGGSVTFSISYMTTTGTYGSLRTDNAQTPTGAWKLSSELGLGSGPYTGWNYAILTITGGGGKLAGAASSLYNLYFDPRMKH